jgi:hypothetical protein
LDREVYEAVFEGFTAALPAGAREVQRDRALASFLHMHLNRLLGIDRASEATAKELWLRSLRTRMESDAVSFRPRTLRQNRPLAK